jgi:hypothetical protein
MRGNWVPAVLTTYTVEWLCGITIDLNVGLARNASLDDTDQWQPCVRVGSFSLVKVLVEVEYTAEH